MQLVSIHADGTPHRLWRDVSKTFLPHTYLIPPGAIVTEAIGKEWSSDYPVVAFFWPKTYFQVFMLLKPHVTDYYCNVIIPPLFGRDVVFIDLELDVIISDGRVELVDEQEFMEQSVLYPSSWVHMGELASRQIMALAKRQWGPFHPAAAQRWRDEFRGVSS